MTPLRDGMNLVAKEYIAAQNPEDPGVLVLSRFAGAVHELEQALIVNPYNLEETASAIQRAFEMPLRERRERWEAMMATIEANDVEHWCRSFLAELTGQAQEAASPVDTKPAAAKEKDAWRTSAAVPAWTTTIGR